MMSWLAVLSSFLYLLFVSAVCLLIHLSFRQLLALQKEEAEDLALLKNTQTDLPKNVISIQPYNVFKEVLIEFLEVEKKTDMYTYATMRSRVLRKAKRLLDME